MPARYVYKHEQVTHCSSIINCPVATVSTHASGNVPITCAGLCAVMWAKHITNLWCFLEVMGVESSTMLVCTGLKTQIILWFTDDNNISTCMFCVN